MPATAAVGVGLPGEIAELDVHAAGAFGQRRKGRGIAGQVDGADVGAGLGQDPHVLAAEAAEGPGDDRHLPRQAEQAAEHLIAHLVIIQLVRVLSVEAGDSSDGA